MFHHRDVSETAKRSIECRLACVRQYIDDVPRLALSMDAFGAFAQVSAHRSGLVLVEDDGEVRGVVSLDDFSKLLQFRRDGAGTAPKTAF